MAAPQCAVEWCSGDAEDVSKQLQLRVGQRQFDPCLYAFCALLKMLLIAYVDTIALPFFQEECGACGASSQNACSYCATLSSRASHVLSWRGGQWCSFVCVLSTAGSRWLPAFSFVARIVCTICSCVIKAFCHTCHGCKVSQSLRV